MSLNCFSEHKPWKCCYKKFTAEAPIKTNQEEISGAAHEFPIPEGLLGLLPFSRILGSPDQSLLLGRGRGGFRAEPRWGFCERKPRAPVLQRSHCAVTWGTSSARRESQPAIPRTFCTTGASKCASFPCVPAEMSPGGAGNPPGEMSSGEVTPLLDSVLCPFWVFTECSDPPGSSK